MIVRIVMGGMILTAFVAGPAPAQQKQPAPAFEFRGERFGDTLTGELRNALSCQADKDVPETLSCRTGSQTGAFTVADVLLFPSRKYFAGKLFELSLTFDSDDYARLTDVFLAHYGAPDSVETVAIQNRAGATFMQTRKIWLFADSRMVVEKYGGTVENGFVWAADQRTLLLYTAKRRAALAAAAARDLGPPRVPR